MAYSLTLPHPLASQGWKVKIRDKEIMEPPHATIIRRERYWRWGLRDCKFMDKQPDPSEVPPAVMEEVQRNHHVLCSEWDKMYPANPVCEKEDEEDE